MGFEDTREETVIGQAMDRMDSFVNCPECGTTVRIIMEPYKTELSDFMKLFEEGIGKSMHFEGNGECGCGHILVASLHVTARARNSGRNEPQNSLKKPAIEEDEG